MIYGYRNRSGLWLVERNGQRLTLRHTVDGGRRAVPPLVTGARAREGLRRASRDGLRAIVGDFGADSTVGREALSILRGK